MTKDTLLGLRDHEIIRQIKEEKLCGAPQSVKIHRTLKRRR